jgi:hypothetical protein
MNNYYENYQKVAEFYPLIIRDFEESEEMLRKELIAMPALLTPFLTLVPGQVELLVLMILPVKLG